MTYLHNPSAENVPPQVCDVSVVRQTVRPGMTFHHSAVVAFVTTTMGGKKGCFLKRCSLLLQS